MNSNKIRKDFPILKREVNGKPLVYFDNGATSQKPQLVIDAINKYYTYQNSNIHRGIHTLSQEATNAYEEARKKVQHFIGAKHEHEIIFTKGTTDSINLVASSFGKKHLEKGDEIIISTMEHHSNIVPWQMICEEKQAILKVIPINDKGELLMDEFERMLSPKTKMVAISHVSNTLGTINPIKKIIKLVRQHTPPSGETEGATLYTTTKCCCLQCTMQGSGASSTNFLKLIFTPRVLKPIFSAVVAKFFKLLPSLVVSDNALNLGNEILLP